MASRNSNMGTREKTVFVAQQLHFAKNLAGNDPRLRARAMKKLRKYFLARNGGNFCFTHDDFMRIWKGLFYCMWMSDKPLIQEELAEEISQLVHCFQSLDSALMFIRSFFDTLAVEWYGIDYHRIDKFQMLVRRFLRQCLVHCKNKKWKQSVVSRLCDVFESTVLSSKCIAECSDLSLVIHFVDIFVEELAKAGAGKLPKDILLEFLKPFISNLMEQEDSRLQTVILDRIFHCLIRQSPGGMEYEEKFEAWKRAGFPGKSWKQMVFVGKQDKRSGVRIKDLDPRAGKVNVYLPHLVFDAKSVAELLREYAEKSSKVSCQKFVRKIARKFQDLAEDNYPLAMNISKALRDSRKYRFSKQKIDDAVEDLINFEEDLTNFDKELESKNKKKRKKDSSNVQSKQPKRLKLETEENIGEDIENSSEPNNIQRIMTKTDNTLSPLILNDASDESELPMLEEHEVHTHFESQTLEEKGQSSWVNNGEYGKENKVKNVNPTKIRRKKKLQKIPSWSVTGISCAKVEVCVNEEKEKKIEDESPRDNEISPVSLRRPGIIRAKRRLSKVPDREIPGLTSETPKAAENFVIPVHDCSNDSLVSEASITVSDNSELEDSFAFPQRTLQSPGKRSPRRKRVSLRSTPASAKKVNIALQMNRTQGFSEYEAAVKQSPSVPHDANKKPFKGVLKRASIGSPINPFYVPPKGMY